MATTLAQRKSYRMRVKSSVCRKKGFSACKKRKS